jgi:hypothetical protein
MSDQPVFGESYKLLWRITGERRIGEVRNYTTDRKGYRTVPVLLDDALMKQICMRFLVTSLGSRGQEIIVSEAFMILPRTFREAAIWHEMGHVHHEHHSIGEFTDQAHLRAARIAAIERGQVMHQEAEADRFAVGRIGKELLIGFLSHLLRTRPTDGTLAWNEMGRRELELRIEAIQALRREEGVRVE